MSAVVGILNKQAIAIAADSAVSINGKIYNRALKIFTLSKHHPIGIMIYSSANFMQTPWETIIKMYRADLGDKSFDTLKDYSINFIEYLHNQNFFSNDELQKEFMMESLFYKLYNTIFNTTKSIFNDGDNFLEILKNECNRLAESWEIDGNLCNEFATFDIEQFNMCFNEVFEVSVTEFFDFRDIALDNLTKENIKKTALGIIRNQEQFTYNTGLVFAGFGEKQIFPSLMSINVHFAIQNRLKYYETNSMQITHNMGSAIMPFAQTDAMNTILRGIAPNLDNMYTQNISKYLTKYNNKIIELTEVTAPEIANAIREINIEEQVKEFNEKIQEAKMTDYINPLMDAVESLSKEDLAEMAESLIYLTFLQKRITFAAEDVGGAVDVAIISKGDGFIWIKRKHYFKPELNKFFFDNYFK
jgi:hypothetical protein